MQKKKSSEPYKPHQQKGISKEDINLRRSILKVNSFDQHNEQKESKVYNKKHPTD